ncbi:MAG: benzoate/H(+) symporter BenE family transporter [Chloroflexi bacterium]|nr:benzoate/H(+) symporter BenE family transporter [Chloroflexota bacterium]
MIASSLGGALSDPDHRDAAVIAFLCTAGDFSLFGIGAPFWGLIAGVAINALLHARRKT